MNPENRAHIEEQRLLAFVVEDSRMTAAEDTHLAQCRQCRSAIEDLKADLTSLRRASERFTPERRRRIVLPESTTPERFGSRPFGWRIAAGAMATVCLAAILWWQVGPRPDRAPLDTAAGVAAIPADPVMLETRLLAENAMPSAYQAITESLDDGFDQGFIDFIIPPLDEESLS
ncbi:MAG: hypothetical protein QNJ01_01850 [Desulfobacterales bacterium]|nr:hypothetical protein [Desulfobacterales bacterium]